MRTTVPTRRPSVVPAVLAVLALLIAAAPAALLAQENPDPPRRGFLFKDARGELAAARARGEADVLLVIASMPGQNDRVAGMIDEMGGTVQFREDRVDYLRARVPVDEVEGLAAHDAVHSVDVSLSDRGRTFGRADAPAAAPPSSPRAAPAAGGASPSLPGTDTTEAPGTGATPRIPQEADTIWPPVFSDHPLTNRYSPLEDIRALEWLERNPTWDGRGVTVAMIDLSPDPLLPELQEARTLDGQVVPKIAFYATATDMEEEPDGRWLAMEAEVTASGGTLTHGGERYTAPRDGSFRVDLLNEKTFDSLSNAGIDEDLNRDENPEGSSRLFAVLWDPETDDVWVDTDQDRDFTDEKALTDYQSRPGFGVFGTDDPETPVRETIGFAVQIDHEKERVGLNMGVASHATLVVGAAVASRGESGRFDGVAPGARLASVAEGGAAYGQTEAAIIAARDAGADVIYFEQSSRITRDYLLRDGRLVPTVIYGRIIAEWGPAIVSPTHNYPILGAPDDFVVGKGVIGIGGHESADNFFHVHGVRVEHHDNLLITGGYGPMGNGALEPDVISPSNYVSTSRGFLPGASIPGLFELPPGYTVAGGTSTATPTAAGAVALLISAAKQAGVPYDPYRIEHALTRSARWVDHLPAYKQGNGVVNVAGAWEILRELADAPDDILNLEIESRAPVRWVYSHLLPTPNEGVGLFEKEGWSPGMAGERTVTLTRTTGPDEPMTFTLSWKGNEAGTFTAPERVTLPLDEPVDVTIGIAPLEPGAHTAHLTVEHPDVPGWAHRMLATVVAAREVGADEGWTTEVKTEVPRPGMHSLFFRVPEGVDAIRVDVAAPDRGVGVTLSRPDTRQQLRSGGGPDDTGTNTHVVQNPMAGMWEVRLDDVADTRSYDWEQAKKDEPVPPTPVTVTFSLLGVDVGSAEDITISPDDGGAQLQGDVGDAAGPGPGPDDGSGRAVRTGREAVGATGIAGAAQETGEVRLANRMASFEGAAEGLPMGSARRERPRIREKEQQVYELQVPAGATHLIVRAGNPDRTDADLDVYVFDCTDEDDGCEGARTDADPVGGETVVVEDPDAGSWKVVVDAFSVPGGSTSYEYLDVVFAPVFGTVGVADTPEEREPGAAWSAATHRWVAGDLGEGREPFAGALVRAEGESGDFTVDLVELPRR